MGTKFHHYASSPCRRSPCWAASAGAADGTSEGAAARRSRPRSPSSWPATSSCGSPTGSAPRPPFTYQLRARVARISGRAAGSAPCDSRSSLSCSPLRRASGGPSRGSWPVASLCALPRNRVSCTHSPTGSARDPRCLRGSPRRIERALVAYQLNWKGENSIRAIAWPSTAREAAPGDRRCGATRPTSPRAGRTTLFVVTESSRVQSLSGEIRPEATRRCDERGRQPPVLPGAGIALAL